MVENYTGTSNRSVIVVVVIVIVVASAYLFLGPELPIGGMPTVPSTTEPTLTNYTSSDPILIRNDNELRTRSLDEGWQGSGTESDPYIIENLRIVTDARSCVLIQNVMEYHFVIRNCYMEATDQSMGVCITVYESTNGVVENCIMSSGYQGMDFFGSSDCEIRDCNINKVGCGVNATLASNITIHGNNIFDCYWAVILGMADSIVLKDNYLVTSEIGIGAYASNNTIILNNSITDNLVGLEAEYHCRNWTINSCLFFNNTDVGLDLKSTTQSFKIFSNQLGLNQLHARDNGVSNSWDNGISVGNEWDDYSGIGAYSIAGSAGSVDHYPSLFVP